MQGQLSCVLLQAGYLFVVSRASASWQLQLQAVSSFETQSVHGRVPAHES